MCVCRGEGEGGGKGGWGTLGLRTIETIRLVTSGGGGATSKSSCACVRPRLIVQCNPTRAIGVRAAIRVGAAGLDSPQQVVVDLHHCTKGLDRTESDRITAAGAVAIAWPMRRTDLRCRAECAVRGAADARAG